MAKNMKFMGYLILTSMLVGVIFLKKIRPRLLKIDGAEEHYGNAVGEKNSEFISRPENIALDREVSTNSSRAPFCTNNIRMALMKWSCKNLNINQQFDKKTVKWMLFDNLHKAAYIVLPKAGSRTWLEFFGKTVGENGSQIHKLVIRRQMQNKGINFTAYTPVNEINIRYKNYTKFVVVRHPLQRFVSGYYEVIVVRHQLRKHCVVIRKRMQNITKDGTYISNECKQNDTLSFTEFAWGFSHSLLPKNEHYCSIQQQSKPCRVEIDMIIKTESGTEDAQLLKQRLNLTQYNLSLDHLHSRHENLRKTASENNISPDLTKYDGMLRDLQEQQPRTFEWLLSYFKTDMEMFGYTWNSKEGISGCSYGGDDSCC